jgi:hypothetical protein
MAVLKELRKRWFVSVLSVAVGLFFAGALAISTLTYVNVMEARDGVALEDAVESVELLSNGSLRVGLTIKLSNPSDFCLRVNSISWAVRIDNSTTGLVFIPVTSVYTSAAADIVVDEGTERVFEYESLISDPAKLAAIRGFVNYSAAQGEDYTVETLPYLHDFRLVAWVDDFDHDYQFYRQFYLNDMVRIERNYYEGEYR